MNGFELAQKLKENPATAKIPLIFLTAKSDITDKFTGYFVGAAEFLSKPFKTDDLVARVNKVLEVDELEQALQLNAATETRNRTASAAAVTENTSAPPATQTAQGFVKIADILGIYDAVMRAIDEEGRKAIEESAFDAAFESAVSGIANTHPELANLHITPGGLNVAEAKRLIKKGNFAAANTAFCEMLKQLFETLAAEKETRNGVTVVVLDRNDESADFIDLVLTEAGFTARRVAEENIFEPSDNGTPNLILANASMENFDIGDFCRRVRGTESLAKVPILAVSDWFDAEQVRAAFASGVTDYLVKPFANTELVSAVVTILRK